MAQRPKLPNGSWLVAEDLLEKGDVDFLSELRRIHDADQLGSFAPTWFNDRRAASRRLLLQYLEQPFNCFRHESLVKRLFKLADAGGDDEMMARFLVGFDRSLRRVKRKRFRYDWNTRQSWSEETLRVPFMTQVPKSEKHVRFDENSKLIVPRFIRPDRIVRLQLFTTATRQYLRRRAWRYFRKIGKSDPVRYISAVSTALQLYRDSDCASGLELIDNWGLVHVLFHDSQVLTSKSHHWNLSDGRSLGELKAAPAFLDAWKAHGGESLLQLVGNSQCRPIRQWAIGLLREYHSGAITGVTINTILKWLNSDDSELSLLAVDMLERSSERALLTTSDWIELTAKCNESALARVCGLVRQRVKPGDVSLVEIIRLACLRPSPLAKLAIDWLKEKPVSAGECQLLARASFAECEPLRPELVRLAMEKIDAVEKSSLDCRLEFLDSRFEDVRAVGWEWIMKSSILRNSPTLWQRLLESPYDDVRLKLVDVLERFKLGLEIEDTGLLEKPAAICKNASSQELLVRDRLDPASVRMLWATVLVNIHRGGKQKPGVIRSIVAMLESNPNELEQLLPLLRTALRSVRVGEWRTALAGLVRLIERRPELTSRVQVLMPEIVLQ